MTTRVGLLAGPPAYPVFARSQPAPRPLVCLGITLAIFAAAMAVGTLIQAAYVDQSGPPPPTGGQWPSDVNLVGLLAFQVTIILLSLLAASRGGLPAAARLFLQQPPQGPAVYLSAFALLLALVAVYNAVAYAVGATDIVSDLKIFIELAQSPYWLIALLVIAVGAPVSEEFLFRGYLLPGLAASAIGFRGATLATSALWTLPHAGYSASGLVEVGLVGVYLAWVLWRTGSLWVPLFCHAAHNLTLMLGLMLWPSPV